MLLLISYSFRPARAASPTASHDTSASSHSSSDKPLAQGNKRRKASPTAEDSSNNPTATTQVVSNILGSTLQVAIPTASTEDSAAPSPAASAPPSNTDVEDAAKDQESHAEAVTNGLLAVVKDKRGADTDQEECKLGIREISVGSFTLTLSVLYSHTCAHNTGRRQCKPLCHGQRKRHQAAKPVYVQARWPWFSRWYEGIAEQKSGISRCC